ARGSLTLQDEYLHQFLVEPDGRRAHETFSAKRQSGEIAPAFEAAAGELFVAHGTVEPPARPPGILDRLQAFAGRAWQSLRSHSPLPPPVSRPLSIALVWDPALRGEAANDQESFRSVFAAYG